MLLVRAVFVLGPLQVAFPLQKKPKLLPAFLFWPCTTVEPIIDRRERDPNEFCQSVPRQARFKLIFLQPFQKASAFSDPNRVFWPPNSHLHKHRRRLGAPSIRRASSRRRNFGRGDSQRLQAVARWGGKMKARKGLVLDAKHSLYGPYSDSECGRYWKRSKSDARFARRAYI